MIIRYVVAVCMLLVFLSLSFLGAIALKQQKAIIVESRLGKQGGISEIINVNIAMILLIIFVLTSYYEFVPVVVCYVVFVMITTKLRSGFVPKGIYVGMTFVPWNKMQGYKFINDSIQSFTVKLRANKRQYVLSCDKEYRQQVESLVRSHLQEKDAHIMVGNPDKLPLGTDNGTTLDFVDTLGESDYNEHSDFEGGNL